MIEGFDEIADELEEIANAFDRMQERKGTEMDASGAIEDGVSRGVKQEIIPEAKRGAEPHVPRADAETIHDVSGQWVRGRYRHYVGATSDLVAYHEFGTGEHGTGNGGYYIRPNGDYPLGIPAEDWDGPSYMVNEETGKVHLEYVYHPGVEAQHFIQDAVEDNAAELRGYILSQINQMFRNNGIK